MRGASAFRYARLRNEMYDCRDREHCDERQWSTVCESAELSHAQSSKFSVHQHAVAHWHAQPMSARQAASNSTPSCDLSEAERNQHGPIASPPDLLALLRTHEHAEPVCWPSPSACRAYQHAVPTSTQSRSACRTHMIAKCETPRPLIERRWSLLVNIETGAVLALSLSDTVH